MAFRFAAVAIFGLFHLTTSTPVVTLRDLEVTDDTMSIGSYIREVRAAAPENYHRVYDNEGDGEIGYSRKKTGSGKKGYQHFDTFHKKAGDAYEFEKQDSYGHDEDGQQGAHSERKEKKAEKYQDSPSEHDGDYHESEGHEGLNDESSDDGNGGVEAHGHDTSDYTLPDEYTYGTGEEYNF